MHHGVAGLRSKLERARYAACGERSPHATDAETRTANIAAASTEVPYLERRALLQLSLKQ
jgi:hypothetical protein